MYNFIAMNILHSLNNLIQQILHLKLCKLFSFSDHFVQGMVTT
jgi:hypothetical protein